MLNKSFSIKIFNKIKPYKKTITVDSDKSISIRSFLIGAISHNISEVKNVLESGDVFSCINCLKKLCEDFPDLGVCQKSLLTPFELPSRGPNYKKRILTCLIRLNE